MTFSRVGRQPHLLIPGGGLSGEVHALRSDVADALGSVAPTLETGTARTLSAADHGTVIICSHASGCAVTVPVLSPGFTCQLISRGAANLTVAGSGGMVITPEATWESSPVSAFGVGSVVVLYVESATVCNASGDLTPA